MKISELSRISQVNPATIRMYREMGLLNPKQDSANQYYNYSEQDLMSLLFIRKMRASGVSLDAIERTYHCGDPDELLAHYQNDLDSVNEEIARLQKQRHALEMTIRHIDQYRSQLPGIGLIRCGEDRIDYYGGLEGAGPFLQTWFRNIECFTQCLRLRWEPDGEELPEWIPVSVGIGTYVTVFEEYHLPIPEGAVRCPSGLYLTARVELTRLDAIHRSQIEPLLRYAADHHYTVMGDTTAFLFRIQPGEKGNLFTYRLRVRVGEGPVC